MGNHPTPIKPAPIILIINLLIDKVYKESRLKCGKSKPAVLTKLVLNGFPAASPHHRVAV